MKFAPCPLCGCPVHRAVDLVFCTSARLRRKVCPYSASVKTHNTIARLVRKGRMLEWLERIAVSDEWVFVKNSCSMVTCCNVRFILADARAWWRKRRARK